MSMTNGCSVPGRRLLETWAKQGSNLRPLACEMNSNHFDAFESCEQTWRNAHLSGICDDQMYFKCDLFDVLWVVLLSVR